MERVIVVPLKRAYLGGRRRRAKRAVKLLKAFVSRHMKAREVKVDPSVFVAFWGTERKRVEEIGDSLWVEGKGTLVLMPVAEPKPAAIDLGEGAGQLAVLMNGKTLYLATDKDSMVAYNTVHAQWSPESV